MAAAHATLKKAILLFDEIHFMDRPPSPLLGALWFDRGTFPLRRFEKSFRENGIPLFVHPSPGVSVAGEFLQQITAGIDDLEFLKRFQAGLNSSSLFHQPRDTTTFLAGKESNLTPQPMAFNPFPSVEYDILSFGFVECPEAVEERSITKPASTQIRCCTGVIGLGTRALFLFPLENSFE
jgi:hypothetical protein